MLKYQCIESQLEATTFKSKIEGMHRQPLRRQVEEIS